MWARWWVAGFVAGVVLGVTPSCGSSSICSPSNCSGCCDSQGQCQSGKLLLTCGINGLTCTACVPGDVCQSGECLARGSDAGCSPADCSGCCLGSQCVPGTERSGCGVSGGNCQVCSGTQICDGTGACQNTQQCQGCNDGTGTCQSGTTSAQCGSGGATCLACDGGASCQNGVCQLPPPADGGTGDAGSGDAGPGGDAGTDAGSCGPGNCSGCCSGTSCISLSNQSTGQCGTAGATCVACSGTDTCQAGSCQTPDAGSTDAGGNTDAGSGSDAGVDAGSCGPSNCAGCCNGTACIAISSESNGQCGANGLACQPCTTGTACQTGACVPTCGPANCGGGCCAGGTCITVANQGNAQCGNSGLVCNACGGAAVCETGICFALMSDAGTRGVTTLSTGSPMPPVWLQTTAQPFATSGNGAASAHVGQLVQIQALLITSHGGATDPQCPLPFVSSGGTHYCDGFDISDGSHAAVVDAFAYLGSGDTACGLPPTDGTQYSTVTGVWEDHHDSTSGADTWVVAPVTCTGAGGGPPDAGNSSVPPVTTDIHTLLSAGVVPGKYATLRGVVVGRWTATSSQAFGFAIEDPPGGPTAGIHVFNPADSGFTTSQAPNIGDYVKVVGVLTVWPTDGGPSYPEVDL
jgi:hypothetical protein